MTRTIRLWLSLAAAAAVITLTPARPGAATPFVLHAGEHICIIGNQLAERMQYEGWLDTLLHARFPRHDLVIRNLGFSGDEVATRLRSKNFGTPDEWLSGVGEAIGGYKENRLKQHQHEGGRDLRVLRLQRVVRRRRRACRPSGSSSTSGSRTRWRRSTTARPRRASCCSRRSRTKISAIPDLPDGKENNARLEMYTLAMSQVAAARGVRFVDLFAPTRSLYATVKTPLTIDGVHLNEEGNRRLAEIIDRDLFGAPPTTPTRATTCQRCSAPSPTRTSTGSTGIAPPTPSPPSAIAPS